MDNYKSNVGDGDDSSGNNEEQQEQVAVIDEAVDIIDEVRDLTEDLEDGPANDEDLNDVLLKEHQGAAAVAADVADAADAVYAADAEEIEARERRVRALEETHPLLRNQPAHIVANDPRYVRLQRACEQLEVAEHKYDKVERRHKNNDRHPAVTAARIKMDDAQSEVSLAEGKLDPGGPSTPNYRPRELQGRFTAAATQGQHARITRRRQRRQQQTATTSQLPLSYWHYRLQRAQAALKTAQEQLKEGDPDTVEVKAAKKEVESARAKYEAERGTDLEMDVLLAKRSSAKQELSDQEKRLLELLKKYPNNPEQEDIVDVSGRLERAWRYFNQIESQIAASEKQSSTAKKSAETPLLSERAPKSGKKDDSSADFEVLEERPFDHWRERLQEAESQLSAAEEALERMRASHAPNSREVQLAAGEVEIAEQRVNAARNKLETVSEETSTQAPELSVAEMNRRYESAKSLVASAQASYRDSEAEFSEDPDNSALIAARGRVRTAWRYLNHILLQMEAAGQSTTAATERTPQQRSLGRRLIQSG
mgnify:CR=1 FL=1